MDAIQTNESLDVSGLAGSAEQIAQAAGLRREFAASIPGAITCARSDSSIPAGILDGIIDRLEILLRCELGQVSAGLWIKRYHDARPTAERLARRVNQIGQRADGSLYIKRRADLDKEIAA